MFMKTFIFFFAAIQIFAQSMPFNKGVNLSGWLQAGSPKEIHFTKYTKQDFENIKSLGADVIRLPINLHSMTLGAPDYELDPLFLKFLDQIIDWTEELEIHLILDNHTFDPAASTDPNIDQILIPVWQNMAEHLKERSRLINYEILNEPHGIGDAVWNEIQLKAINAIREIDSVHTIIVGPAGWNSYNNLKFMPEYEDDNLIYTFHFYDPFIFTHQGASWTDPSMVPLGGVPFPYNSAEMPDVPPELHGTWVASSMNNYQNEGTIAKIREILDIAAQFKEERGVPVFCGEFGVLMDNAENNDRVLWYQVVRSYLESKDISWTSWDYHGGFGIFEKNSAGLFNHDLNVNLLKALGFNVPLQTDFEIKPDSTGFGIYSDYIENGMVSSSNSNGSINFYSENANAGEYAISWTNPAQYNSVGFKFLPIKDLSYLEKNNYYVGFWIKSDNPFVKFDIRFIDTKENAADHPWRMSYTLDNSNNSLDGNWNYVQIPLSTFTECGSWDDAWFEPHDLFDWSSVDLFEIVDEHGLLYSTQLLFDDIKIFDPNAVSIEENVLVKNYELNQNYPNPFNPVTTIEFEIPKRENVELNVYDLLGREISTLVNKTLESGKHKVEFDYSSLGFGLSSGVYIYRLRAGQFFESKKAVLLK